VGEKRVCVCVYAFWTRRPGLDAQAGRGGDGAGTGTGTGTRTHTRGRSKGRGLRAPACVLHGRTPDIGSLPACHIVTHMALREGREVERFIYNRNC